MNQTIWKFEVDVGENKLQLPQGARVIEFQSQNGRLYIWALVVRNAPGEERRMWVYGTGFPIPSGCEYIATAHAPPFVWHLFDMDGKRIAQ